MSITKDLYYIGVNDHNIDLFEGQYTVPNGMAYNSYVIKDEKIAVLDTVEINFLHEWLDNMQAVLGDVAPDYLIVHHMEPDHSANIAKFLSLYPNTTVVASEKAFTMMENFFGQNYEDRRIIVGNGDTLSLGKHELTFVAAPMVHWPEVLMSYDAYDKTLFSADGFGKFGALDVEEDWDCEARRYYFGIVGKYGAQVANVLKKAESLEIERICSLHGPVLEGDLSHYIEQYKAWSSYRIEKEGILIAYTSVYGNTKKAVELLADKLKEKGCPNVVVMDLAREDWSEAVEAAFEYGKIVFATTTYNAEIFPFMKQFIDHLTERNFQKRTIGFIENGSWAPLAAKIMREMFANSKDIDYLNTTVKIKSAMNDENKEQIEAMADELCRDYVERETNTAHKADMTALFRLGYGLYVVTSNDGKHDNGLIVNTVSQVAESPNRIAVNINKANYSHHVIQQTGKLNVNVLSVDAPFKVFETFGFQSGRNVDKFAEKNPARSDNGLAILPKYINACISLTVDQYVDLGTHGMFICTIDEARVMSDRPTMTYTYYQENVKPKPQTDGVKGWVCTVCGYIYEGEEIPDDFICPLCKHGVSDFEKIG